MATRHHLIRIILLALMGSALPSLLFPETSPYSYKPQPKSIETLIAGEKDAGRLRAMIDIVNRIDATYGGMYDTLAAGKKITIFMDPAHGRLENGRWESEATGRVSCSGLREEYYANIISREIYKLITANKFLELKSTDDFLAVSRGESEEYRNIYFPETVKRAYREGAFLIISEHMNNIATIHKASGIANLPGIHITQDKWGNRYLTFVRDIYRGYLTLYNKLDVTGFSRAYADRLKEILLGAGLRPNNWEMGSVADDRFSYFTDFPVSVIFESGFISNPDEEILLRDPAYLKKLADAQYQALLDCLRTHFNVDLSGDRPKRVKENFNADFEFLKLSRLAIYYVESCESRKAVSIIDLMNRQYGKSGPAVLRPYLDIRASLLKADRYHRLGEKALKAKNHKKAARFFMAAKRSLRARPHFNALACLYGTSYHKLVSSAKEATIAAAPVKKDQPAQPPKKTEAIRIVRASLSTPIILPVENRYNLEDALDKALGSGPEVRQKVLKTLKNAQTTERVKVKKTWKKKKVRVTFTEGIYIVRINKNLSLSDVKRVPKVLLNPAKYQNQQYFKNSCFALDDKQKSL